jgi:hypothetical protein
MKVRWTNGSVRFRITPKELDTLIAGDAIETSLAAPGGSWRVVIQAAAETRIAMVEGVLQVTIDAADRDRLADAETEGVYFSSEGNEPLRYYVEKDFPCVHPRPPAAHDPVTETFAPPEDFKLRHKTECI